MKKNSLLKIIAIIFAVSIFGANEATAYVESAIKNSRDEVTQSAEKKDKKKKSEEPKKKSKKEGKKNKKSRKDGKKQAKKSEEEKKEKKKKKSAAKKSETADSPELTAPKPSAKKPVTDPTPTPSPKAEPKPSPKPELRARVDHRPPPPVIAIPKKPIVRPLGKIDPRLNPKLIEAADIAKERANAKSKHRCWEYVKKALLAAKVIFTYPKTNEAREAADELVRKYGFRRLPIHNQYDAPIGSILVFEGGRYGRGHVMIRTETGFVSDYWTKNRCKYRLVAVLGRFDKN